MVDRGWAWHGAHIEENTDVWLEDGAEGIEEPPMRVNLLLILLFEAEYDLHGNDTLLRPFDFH